MGTPIDTSRLEADIAMAEAAHKQKPDDEKARLDLAHAYLARAQVLTKAQQYGSALGDYRRTLKYDPQNKAALDMSATIISIFKSLGREAPAEGKEPPPKPLTGTSKDAASYSEKSY
jgi:tetratricopeptide (TPR) repeat protein